MGGWCLGWVLALAGGCAKWPDQPPDGAVSGTIETDEVRVASRYGGRVEALLAQEGEALKPGQAVARLEAAELRARREMAAAALAEGKAGPRPQEIQAAKDDWEAVQAQVAFARADARRVTELWQQKTAPESERDRAVAQANALEKNAAAAQSRYELLLAGTRPERIQQAAAQLAEIEAHLTEMEIRAPTNAVLEAWHVKAGDAPGPNQPLATLVLTGQLWVRVYVPEPWLGHIQLGQTVAVKVDAFAERTFEGEVAQIARTAEFTPRNVQTVSDRVKQVFAIKVRLPTEDGALRAGMAADVTFASVPKDLY